MRRFRPHRTAALVLALLVVASVGASLTASKGVADNEARLLRDRTSEVGSLLESLGSGYEAQMASVAAIAEITGGDPAEFQTAVAGVDAAAATATSGGWRLLRHTDAGFIDVAAVGAATPLSGLPPEWTAALELAAAGHFSVLGFLGGEQNRRLVMAIGRLGVGGEVVVLNEVSLIGATASAAGDDTDEVISGVAIKVFVGTEPDPDQLLLAFGTADEHKLERRVINVSGVDLLLEVSALEPLGGGVATQLPDWLLASGLLLGLSIASVVEMSQRRRDDAMATVRDLERQNRRLDAALAEQQAAEAARAALEVELRQAQRLEAVGHLAGGVAHDFNNVLAAILSYADLATDGVTDPSALDDLESIKSAARRGAGLTRQLLQFSRRESGEASVVDVNERIADVVSMLERAIGEDISLRTSLVAGPAPVLADPVELDQVVLNLVVNASDAVSRGGTITVATELVDLDASDLVHQPGLVPGRYVRLTVTDDGHGMTSDVLEHAFEPFFTTKGRGQGTGLGLSTVYGIVQRQGGHVVGHSTPGGGSTIEVLLPACNLAPSSPVPATSAASPRAGGGRTVLVVEDEQPLRLAMRRMLERAGFRVLEADDGTSALHRHGGADIDLLLTDIVMPGGLTGVDVADGFRTSAASLPVVYVTGYSDDILDPARIDGSTPTSVLTKPFTEADLLQVVGAALGGR